MFFLLRILVPLCLCLVQALPVHAKDEAQTPTLNVGLAAENAEQYLALCKRYAACDHVRTFYSLSARVNKNDPYKWVRRPYLDRGIPVVMNLLVRADDPSQGHNQQVLHGQKDGELRALARAIKKDGRPIIIAPFHEGNGDWYAWGAYARGNTPDSFVAAYRHVVKLFREEGATNARFEMNFNRRSAGKHGVKDFASVYPGEDVVDVISISSYDRCGTNKQYPTQQSFAEGVEPAVKAIRAFTDKPIAIAETATSPHCGEDQIAWYRDAFTTMRMLGIERVSFFFLPRKKGEASLLRDTNWAPKDQHGFRTLIGEVRRSSFTTSPESNTAIAPRSGIFGHPEYPWSVYGRLDHFLSEKPNSALNTLTGDEFGSIGSRFRIQLNQGIEWSLNEQVTVGPRFSVKGVTSTNRDQWWNNNVSVGAEMRLCRKATFADWGSFCAFAGGEHLIYTGETPERYGSGLFGQGHETRAFIGAEVSFGGKH